MSNIVNTLEMRFDGTTTDRKEFLRRIRTAVIELTGERMTLDALINEIAKNIFDHAHGLGSLIIKNQNGAFEFEIKDDGESAYDFETCSTCSRLVGNGVNFGIGLKTICELARDLDIDLCINTSKGFSYSGVYVPQSRVN